MSELANNTQNTDRLGSLDGLIGKEALLLSTERLDNADEIFELEMRHQGLEYIRRSFALEELSPLERALAPLNRPMHGANHIGNQFGDRIMPCFLSEDGERGLEDFRLLNPHTTDEELVLLVNDDQFRIAELLV